MTPTLVIARLTVREAVRRKLVLVFLLITVGMVSLSAWGFDRLAHSRSITSGETGAALPQALILFMFMFSFVVALSASAIASPAVSAEVESGVLQTVATRPIRRSQILAGKWLGLAFLVAAYSTVVAVLEMVVVKAVSGFLPPNPVAVAVYLFSEGAILLTLVLAISTRLSTLATGVTGVALFGSAWLAGVVGALGTTFNIAALRTVGQVARFIVRRLSDAPDSGGNPFFATAPPSWAYIAWAAVWFLAVGAVALFSFQRREL